MPKLVNLTVVAACLALSACSAMVRSIPLPGDSRDIVVAKFGSPTGVYATASGQVLEYATGPMGQQTYMASLGEDGRLRAFEQVLTGEKFATLKIGSATKEQVLHTIGRPSERSYLRLRDYEVWSYRYKESGVWNSMMHVHFDRAGVLRMLQNGPDPMYEERRFFRD